MSITLEQAKALSYGDHVNTPAYKNADGTVQRWRVSGKPKVWKTRPDEVRVPIKRGMYANAYIEETTLDQFELGYGS